MPEQTTDPTDHRSHGSGRGASDAGHDTRIDRAPVPWRARRLVAASSVLVVLALTACSGSDDDADPLGGVTETERSGSGDDAARDLDTEDTGDSADTAPGVDGDTGADDGQAADGAPGSAGDLDGEAVQTVGARTGRRIVRSAQLDLEVQDTAGAADEVAVIADRAGGFVAETDLVRESDGLVRGSITLRVPSAALFDTVEQLDALAVAVPVRRIDERDVTAESTDLDARLTNLTAYEIELRALLSDVRETTTRPDDLLVVFERIRSVRADIDQAEARLAVLDDQVALSTIRVSLLPAASAVPVVDPTWAPSETVRESLTSTSRALATIADAAIRFTVTVLPVGLLLAAPVIVAVAAWRRVRARRTSSTSPPRTPSSAPPATDPGAPPASAAS